MTDFPEGRQPRLPPFRFGALSKLSRDGGIGPHRARMGFVADPFASSFLQD
jgi:hypothetical protein